MSPEVGIYKREISRKKERKHALDQENKIQEKTTTSEKKEGNGKRKLELNL